MFFSGDWAGATRVALTGVGAMFGLQLLLSLVAIIGLDNGPTGSQLIGDVSRTVSLAVGGDLRFESSSLLGGSSGSLSYRPLGLTFLGFALIGVLFVRRFNSGSGVPTPLQIGLQALRVGLVLSGALLVVAILGRMGGGEFSSAPKADVFSTLFFGLITLAVALAFAGVLGLPSLFPGRAGHYRALIFGPLRASLILAVIASVATAVILIVVLLTELEDQVSFVWRLIPSLVLLAPNVAGYALLLGMGIPVNANADTSAGGSSSSVSILDLADADSRYWLWPLVVIALLIMTGVISARRSPIGPNGRPIGYWLAAVLPVVLLIYAMLVPVRGGAGYGFLSFRGSVEFDPLFTILLGAAFGLAAGYLGSVFVSRPTLEPFPVPPPAPPIAGPSPAAPEASPVAPPVAPTGGPLPGPSPASPPAAPPAPPPPAGPIPGAEPPTNPSSPTAG